MVTFFACAVAFLISFCSMPFLRRLAWRINLLDFPEEERFINPTLSGWRFIWGYALRYLIFRISQDFSHSFRPPNLHSGFDHDLRELRPRQGLSARYLYPCLL